MIPKPMVWDRSFWPVRKFTGCCKSTNNIPIVKTILTTLALLCIACAYGQSRGFNTKENGTSFYQKRLQDSDAVYFTAENYHIKADGSMDVSDALQQAIADLKTQHNFGILFIPEGTYLISKTIYVPQAVRLI